MTTPAVTIDDFVVLCDVTHDARVPDDWFINQALLEVARQLGLPAKLRVHNSCGFDGGKIPARVRVGLRLTGWKTAKHGKSMIIEYAAFGADGAPVAWSYSLGEKPQATPIYFIKKLAKGGEEVIEFDDALVAKTNALLKRAKTAKAAKPKGKRA